MTKKFEDLMRKKRGLALTVAQIQGHVSAHSTTALDKFKVEVYLEKVKEIYEETTHIYTEIFGCCDATEVTTHETERTEFLNTIMDLLADLKAIQAQVDPKPTPSAGGGGPSSSSASVKLPKLNIPKFSGELFEWRTFKDLFMAAVDSAPICNAQKLQHLKSLLDPEPLKSILGITITDGNYATAWKILCDRYDDANVLKTAYLRTLLTQPYLKEESSSNLRKMLDTTTECERNLKALGCPTQHWDDIFVHVMGQRLDPESRKMWELHKSSLTAVNWEAIKKFITHRTQALEAMSAHQKKPQQQQQQQKSNANSGPPMNNSNGGKKQVASHATTTTNASHPSSNPNCDVCKKGHNTWSCPSLTSAPVGERRTLVRNNNLCYNCLRKGHTMENCTGGTCKKCHRKHHTLLHEERNEQSSSSSSHTTSSSTQSSSPSPTVEKKQSGDSSSVATTQSASFLTGKKSAQSDVLLATAIIRVQDGYGNFRSCRALLDPCSQSTLITRKCVQRLRLKPFKATMTITGVGDQQCHQSSAAVTVVIGSSLDTSFTATTNAHIMPVVTKKLPTFSMGSNDWSHLAHLTLADDSYHHSRDVDILIGADLYYECLLDGLVKPKHGAPAAQLTVFGWVLGGPVEKESSSLSSCLFTQSSSPLSNEDVRRFFELEDVPLASSLSKEEELCERHFVSTHKRDTTGRYIVRLPFNPTARPLGNSLAAARSRFEQLERRFARNPQLKSAYEAFISEYISLGHMHEVPAEESPDCQSYYMPHQAVIRSDSSTTKLRVVFDASCKTTNGNSLNDNLLVGPICQSDLLGILLRFRQFPIALKADVEKMFRQVNVCPADTPFQRILWRNNPGDNLTHYELSTVTYGTASAPFLATRSLVQLSHDEETSFPHACQVIRRDFYVDDLMSSVPTESLALQLQRDLMEVCQRGGFPLRKWCSNKESLINAVNPEFREPKLSLTITEGQQTIKTLGVSWDASADTFRFAVTFDNNAKLTKRQVLSETARIFDPLGWLAPITVSAKIILQQLWKLQLDWDDDLPDEPDNIRQQWLNLRGEFNLLENLIIPRFASLNGATQYELCGFSDASEKAYSACVYLRSKSSDGRINVSLIASKTRVAPTKVITLPKLELCGAALLSKLMTVIQQQLTIPINAVHLWTDSTIVLAWLSTESYKLKTFVANRVALIQSTHPAEGWSHVKGTENPADCASRGLLPSELLTHDLWWSGPEWLSDPEFDIQLASTTTVEELDQKQVQAEFKRNSTLVSMTTTATADELFSRFSTLNKLNRVIAYMRRFVSNCRPNLGPRRYGNLTAVELNTAFLLVIRLVQQQSFSCEIDSIKSSDQLPAKSQLIGLKPFLDDNGLLRVGGRIQKSELPFNQKHPLVLPKEHHVSLLIVRDIHTSLMHAGPSLMLAGLRQRGIWVINAKRLARHVLSKCVKCVRHRASTLNSEMADLPSDRVSSHGAFVITGVDYCGPFYNKQIHGRTTKVWKIYVAVFVCFATKAVHLEAVRDLTTEAYVAALRRFVSIRGKPSVIWSDNATNLKGASTELLTLKEIEQSDDITGELSNNGITFKFIPPRAPHHGGLWESAVKSLKHHLVRVIGANILTFDQFDTLIAQVAAILNSRPLRPLSTDPEDIEILTPGHFLILRSPSSLPDPDVTTINENRLSHWEFVQRKVQDFWKSWSHDYLHTLQQRTKWHGENCNVHIGDICVIKHDNLPPTKWFLGRIIKLHPGSDGKIRVVTLRTKKGEFTRPIVKVCVLPVDHSDSDSVVQ